MTSRTKIGREGDELNMNNDNDNDNQRNARYYTDQYGNGWMAYDSDPMPFVPSRRCRIMIEVASFLPN